jgi:signal transduction histidine kinase
MVGRRTALWIAAAAGVLVTLLVAFGVPDTIELPIRDGLLRLLPQESAAATAVVAIDESSIRQVGPWPWSRPAIAAVVDHIAASGARGIVLDILLADSRPGDDVLAASMRRVPTITIAAIGDRGEWLIPVTSLRDASTVAHGNFELDHDGILRRLAATKQSGDRALTAVCIEAASLVRPMRVAAGRAVLPAFRTPPGAIPIISAAGLLRNNSVAAQLRGRIVFVGPTAMALGDRVLTPVSILPDPGVTVHAAATESLVRGQEIHNMVPAATGLVAAAFVAAVLLIRSRAARLVAAAALVLLTIGGTAMLLATTGNSLPVVTLALSVVASAAAIEIRLITSALRQSSAVAARIESGMGMPARTEDREVGPRLEEIATRLAEYRADEAESKRVLAHELKTPLASMRGLSQLLSGFELSDAERRRVASLLESEAGKLESMVHGLLDIERLPLRNFEASSSVIDLGDVVTRRVEFLRASTDREMVVSIDQGTWVRGDAELMERVVDNFVGNALKYTIAPFAVRVRRVDGSGMIEVEDGGPGISDADRERIFQRFFRGHSAAGTQGLGLGLALVAEIARWHGGAVSVDRASSGGSIFRLSLPLAAALAKAGGM